MVRFLRLVSDLHLDHDADRWQSLSGKDKRKTDELDYLWTPPELAEDSETVMLIPGDIWNEHRVFMKRHGAAESYVERLCKRFRAVICVLGNHDCWGTTIERALEKGRELTAHIPNFHLLERSSIVIDDVKLIGATLWTDFDRGNPHALMDAAKLMNDYVYIRKRVGVPGNELYRKLWVNDVYELHRASREYLLDNAKRDNPEQKVVVLSHHAPSWQSIDPEYVSEASNAYYATELGWSMCSDEFQADLWVHGHIHNPCDYVIDRTRITCNPRGYWPLQKTGYDPLLRFDVSQLRRERDVSDKLDGEGVAYDAASSLRDL